MAKLIFSEETLKRLFDDFKLSETSSDWIIDKDCFLGKSCKIKINKNKINNLLIRSQNYQINNFTLYNNGGIPAKTFEHIIRIVYKHQSIDIDEFKTKTLEISISPMNDLYSLFLYLSYPLNSLYPNGDIELSMMLGKDYDGETVDFWEIIEYLNKEIFNGISLKIKSLMPLSHRYLDKLSKAYIFNCSYRHNAILSMQIPFNENNALYPNQYCFDTRIFSLEINDELLNYYQNAIGLIDPFISFLSFYHIFEYFFKLVEDEFKKDFKITLQSTFMGSEEELKKLYLCELNELKLLELVFRKFVNKERLKFELSCIKEDYYSYLIDHEVKFADANKIDDKNFYKSLSKRIYTTRNAVVHRKEGNKPKYLPFINEHKNELREELLLMKTIANHIIINSSKNLS